MSDKYAEFKAAEVEKWRRVPRVNGRIDWETLAAIFVARHLDRLGSRDDFEAVRADLAAFLRERIG